MNNPYAWNIVNPDLCYGRDELAQEFINGLTGYPPTSFGLAGGRRIGKSTFLRHIELEIRARLESWLTESLQVLPIYVDGLALPRPLEAADIWAAILKELEKLLSVEVAILEKGIDFDIFKEIVASHLQKVAYSPRIIVVFDEVEPILACEWGHGFLANWRALLGNTPYLSKYITAVFAGANEMAELQKDVGSPLADILEWRSLHALAADDACRLMQEPIEVEWPSSFLTHAYQETGGHPMLLQYVMRQVCAMTGEADQVLIQAIAKFERDQYRQFNEWWHKYCPSTARRIFARLPDTGGLIALKDLTDEFGSKETAEAMKVLQHLGLAVAEDDGFAFRYNGEMFRRWYRVYGVIGERNQHDLEIYEKLKGINQTFADKYLSAWRIYEQEMPNYSGVLAEMRGVLENLVDRFASKAHVQAQPGFKLEAGQTQASLRQQIEFMVRQKSGKEIAKQTVHDFNLFNIDSGNLLAQLAAQAHRTSSGMVHTTATREQAAKALRQWDSILAQLLW